MTETDPAPEATQHRDKPGGALQSARPKSNADLAAIPSLDLAKELVARLRADTVFTNKGGEAWIGAQLAALLRTQLDVHENRFSRKRYSDVFQASYTRVPEHPPLDGATIVELGCGSVNPGAMAFLFLALGARRAYAIDLDPVADVDLAIRALADMVPMLVLDAASIAAGAAVPPATILANLATFDLARLRVGDLDGVDQDRLCYRVESAYETSIGDAEADFAFSNSFLEHVPDLDATLREMARFTKPGGMVSHVIDLTDHRRYADSSLHPLEFLREPGMEPMFGCNRLRRVHLVQAFEAHGFEIVECTVLRRMPIENEFRQLLASPWSELDDDELGVLNLRIAARRRGDSH